MLVKDAIARLCEFDPELPLKIATQAGGEFVFELRSLVNANRDSIHSEELAVCGFGSNGGRFGYDPLNLEDRWKILDDYKSGKRFTSIHGDCRMYHSYGGSNDTCYGTAYHPALFLKLAEEGYLKRHNGEYPLSDLYYSRTDKKREEPST